MEALFLKLVNLSINAGWLVLVVMLARVVFRRCPKWVFCLLWGIVALRLLCPFTLESSLSLLPSGEPLPKEIIYTAQPQIQSGINVMDNAINPVLSDVLAAPNHEVVSANPMQIWSFILACVWAMGCGMMLVYGLVSTLMLRRRLATATLLEKGIKQSEWIESPIVFGFFRPTIYLPYHLNKQDITYVIAHERAHIQRKDHLWKALSFLLLSVYWFHPLMWVAFILFSRDVESACDEKAIQAMRVEQRRAYAMALLNCSTNHFQRLVYPLAFGEIGVKERVSNVMNYKKPAFWVVVVAVVECVALAVGFLTSPKFKPYDQSYSFDVNGRHIAGEVINGGELTLSGLETDTANGYSWDVADNSNIFAKDYGNVYSENGRDKTLLHFTARDDGNATVTLQYTDADGTAAETVALNATLERHGTHLQFTKVTLTPMEVEAQVPTKYRAEEALFGFFDGFSKGDYASMRDYCTEDFQQTYFHEEDVFGMKTAKIQEMVGEGLPDDSFTFTLDVTMEPSEMSALYPETSTTFFVHVAKSDDRWLIDGLSTDGFFDNANGQEEKVLLTEGKAAYQASLKARAYIEFHKNEYPDADYDAIEPDVTVELVDSEEFDTKAYKVHVEYFLPDAAPAPAFEMLIDANSGDTLKNTPLNH